MIRLSFFFVFQSRQARVGDTGHSPTLQKKPSCQNNNSQGRLA
jgi:hypothetical protein